MSTQNDGTWQPPTNEEARDDEQSNEHAERPATESGDPEALGHEQLDRLAERGWNALAATELEFIVFRDIDNDKVSVIYKRTDNNLGLIAPEF